MPITKKAVTLKKMLADSSEIIKVVGKFFYYGYHRPNDEKCVIVGVNRPACRVNIVFLESGECKNVCMSSVYKMVE